MASGSTNEKAIQMPETNGNQTRPYTEDFALRDILEWSSKRPDWLTPMTMAVRVTAYPQSSIGLGCLVKH